MPIERTRMQYHVGIDSKVIKRKGACTQYGIVHKAMDSFFFLVTFTL